MDTTRIQEVRERMERAQLMRMQPRFIEQFFLRAFQHFGGQVVRRDRTFEVRHVPSRIRARDRQIGMRAPVLARYERITFEKSLVSSQVEFVCPGHPLLEALISLVHQDLGGLLRNGSVLIDRTDPGVEPWVLVTLEHTIRDADRDISRRLLFARVRPGGRVEPIGFAPHVDMRLPTAEERRALEPELDAGWLRAELEHAALGFAARELVPGHRHDVEPPRLELLEKNRREVQQRLTHEYNYWDRRAIELREQQRAGKQPKMNADEAERRADNLRTRLQDRLERIGRQKSLVLGSPVVTSGCFVAPIGLVDALLDRQPSSGNTASREEIDRIDRLAVARVLETERRLGRRPVEQAHNNPGYDVESKVLDADGNETGQLVWLEVKGKAAGRTEVTVSATQINMSFHEPDKWVLAIVPIDGDTAGEPVYVRRPFDDMASDQVASTNFKLDRLIARGGPPS